MKFVSPVLYADISGTEGGLVLADTKGDNVVYSDTHDRFNIDFICEGNICEDYQQLFCINKEGWVHNVHI